MIIQSSNIKLVSEHEKIEKQSEKEVTVVRAESIEGEMRGVQNLFNVWREEEEFSFEESLKAISEAKEGSSSDKQYLGTKGELWDGLINTISNTGSLDQSINPSSDRLSTPGPSGRVTLLFNSEEKVSEYEKTDFASTGKVITADGREIEFDLALSMERGYATTRTEEYEVIVELRDPLVFNFAGNAADLTDEKFSFDLDADGDEELISYLAGESGMLALDLNEDGIINDGTELFGALSGNGFADLAAYDEDGNGFIDEGDSVFDDLLIWRKTEDIDELTSLQQNDVGAIYLGSVDTSFDIKGENNETNGRIRSSGIYLAESGTVGTVQQIDMAV